MEIVECYKIPFVGKISIVTIAKCDLNEDYHPNEVGKFIVFHNNRGIRYFKNLSHARWLLFEIINKTLEEQELQITELKQKLRRKSLERLHEYRIYEGGL